MILRDAPSDRHSPTKQNQLYRSSLYVWSITLLTCTKQNRRIINICLMSTSPEILQTFTKNFIAEKCLLLFQCAFPRISIDGTDPTIMNDVNITFKVKLVS